ncbi:hypothetical protein PO124_09415 [Bacillus licheniformis]|nr:hypothetical protein [Bacillus licheniformis]
MIVITAGAVGEAGTTNLMKVYVVGDVVAKARASDANPRLVKWSSLKRTRSGQKMKDGAV